MSSELSIKNVAGQVSFFEREVAAKNDAHYHDVQEASGVDDPSEALLFASIEVTSKEQLEEIVAAFPREAARGRDMVVVRFNAPSAAGFPRYGLLFADQIVDLENMEANDQLTIGAEAATVVAIADSDDEVEQNVGSRLGRGGRYVAGSALFVFGALMCEGPWALVGIPTALGGVALIGNTIDRSIMAGKPEGEPSKLLEGLRPPQE